MLNFEPIYETILKAELSSINLGKKKSPLTPFLKTLISRANQNDHFIVNIYSIPYTVPIQNKENK